jgi:AbrB family looped-hinge helix DNA binding protein
MTAMLSEKGQVTIPKVIRDELGLVKGSVLDFHEDNGRVVITKVVVANPISKWRGRGKLPFGRTVDEYVNVIRERR